MTRPYENTYLRAERLIFSRDADAAKAPRPVPRPPIRRRLLADGVTYTAFDAHRLLEAESEALQIRPGHPVG